MPAISRLYNFVAGTPAVADQVDAEFDQLVATVNSLDAANLAPAVAAILGLSQSGVVRRGGTYIATEQTRTNTAYSTLTTPDQVASVVIPARGLCRVTFQAMWKESVAGSARAAIFLGSNQLKVQSEPNQAAVTTAARIIANSTGYTPLFTASGGLYSVASPDGAADYGADVATGQAIGVVGLAAANAGVELNGTSQSLAEPLGVGTCVLKGDPVADLTVTISVQFKASGVATVSAKNRLLVVETVGP